MRTKIFKPWRIVVAIRNRGGAMRADPTHSSELRRASWLTFDAAFRRSFLCHGNVAVGAHVARLRRGCGPKRDFLP